MQIPSGKEDGFLSKAEEKNLTNISTTGKMRMLFITCGPGYPIPGFPIGPSKPVRPRSPFRKKKANNK